MFLNTQKIFPLWANGSSDCIRYPQKLSPLLNFGLSLYQNSRVPQVGPEVTGSKQRSVGEYSHVMNFSLAQRKSSASLWRVNGDIIPDLSVT